VTLLFLRSARLALDLAPASGGSIARFTAEGRDVLRPMVPAELASGRGNNSSCYPLVPFSNRIANGHLAFDGATIALQPNWPGVRHPMHGDGWASPWIVARSDARSAELVYEHDGQQGWPFRYRAKQMFRLGKATLTVALTLENLESRTVPGGMGLHPFFVRDPDSELRFDAEAVCLADEEVLPTARVPIPGEWDFRHARRVDETVLDNCFSGWEGTASIVWPSRRLRLDLVATKPFRNLVVFVPPHRPFFCVEPVSHANGAIASTRLATGATLRGEIAFTISDL
jgi:aldose 1-epimerase